MAVKDLIAYLQNFPGFVLTGFGREGKSSYRFLRKHFSDKQIIIADKDPQSADSLSEKQNDPKLHIKTGENYLTDLPEEFMMLLSPGIKLTEKLKNNSRLTSQTDLFLQFYKKQTIGVTGTKGKSTTSALISHIFQSAGIDHVLLGNIGSPPFDHLDKINAGTHVVFELSSHQLSTSRHSPAVSVLLNLFNEHLDHYDSAHHYFSSKMNIYRYQDKEDILICNADNSLLNEYLQKIPPAGNVYGFTVSGREEKQGLFLKNSEVISKINHVERSLLNTGDILLKGQHNLLNVLAAACATLLTGTDPNKIREGIKSFQGLEHRLEYAGVYHSRHFYNDSIATVPEASIAAMNALKDVNTLILGGYDRGLDYKELYHALISAPVSNIIFTGDAGKRMYEELIQLKRIEGLYFEKDFKKAVAIAVARTPENGICLLSPAAASYDQFKNFEERGNVFKELISGS